MSGIPELAQSYLMGLEVILVAELSGKRRLLDELVEPMFEDFKIVHQSYMENLRAFRKLVAEGEDLPAVIQQIQEERLFSESKRSEIRAMVRAHIDRTGSSADREDSFTNRNTPF